MSIHLNKLTFVYRRKIYHNSKIPLMRNIKRDFASVSGGLDHNGVSNQGTLPKLPVPPLQETLKKYLKSVKPFVTEREFEITKKIVETFGAKNGLGEKLQSSIEEKAKNTENWLNDWWTNYAYLDYRSSLIINSSPGLVLTTLEEASNLDEQLNIAARLIYAVVEFKFRIDGKDYPVNKAGEETFNFSECLKIFGTCRIPGASRDSIEHHCIGPNHSNHIVVIHKNHFFKIDVYKKGEKPLSAHQISHQLKTCIKSSTPKAIPVGILTTQNRNVWYKIYEQLCKDNINRESIEEIQRSLFLVCIDEKTKNPNESRITDTVLQGLHGNGASGNAGNRWYDKTLQYIIGENGEVGSCLEHSPLDGVLMIKLQNYAAKYLKENKRIQTSDSDLNLPEPKLLQFNINPEMELEIETAKQELERLVQDLEFSVYTFHHFGKDFIKSQKLSPDSFIQMAFQLAFYRIHKEPGAQYESASTSKFLHGRTETIRSCSEESVIFAQVMLDSKATKSHKLLALKSAFEAHLLYVKDAVNGQGIDRHLLGLQMTAIELGMEVPALFKDIAFIKSSNMRLSTSQVPSEHEFFAGYGPTALDGYGCFYSPMADKISFGISALNSSPASDIEVFKQALEKSLNDMKEVLLQNDKIKSNL